MKSESRSAVLRLEDGSEYEGQAFGAARSVRGEVVFSTGMVGYPQSLTDPSYKGQILCLCYPLAGNYGIPAPGTDRWGVPLHFESERIHASALVVSELCESPSHHSSRQGLAEWMQKEGVPGIRGVDTRSLTRKLREAGVMGGRIIVEGGEDSKEEGQLQQPVPSVSCRAPRLYESPGSKGPLVALLDCGVKANILRVLLSAGARVLRLPWDHPMDGLEFDGLLISNGPGDPKACTKTIASARKAMARGKPIFGICLGNQILGLAAGADTYKLPYGHRGQNQPVQEKGSGRCYMSSQNHGYAVGEDSLPAGWEPWFSNPNDGTIEGIRCLRKPFSAVQFHPEGCPGPRDTQFLLEGFVGGLKAEARLP
ncbi:MAG: glutamine-hydrolyzing carbamoyl-phosphate synthase small subunit [Spirochaetota bacterium]